MTLQHGVYKKEDSPDNQRNYLALKDLEKGLTKKNVTEKYSVPQNTLTYWIKHREDIISKHESGQFGAKRRKLRVGKMIPLIIREKALDFAKEFNIMDFKASEGWLDW